MATSFNNTSRSKKNVMSNYETLLPSTFTSTVISVNDGSNSYYAKIILQADPNENAINDTTFATDYHDCDLDYINISTSLFYNTGQCRFPRSYVTIHTAFSYSSSDYSSDLRCPTGSIKVKVRIGNRTFIKDVLSSRTYFRQTYNGNDAYFVNDNIGLFGHAYDGTRQTDDCYIEILDQNNRVIGQSSYFSLSYNPVCSCTTPTTNLQYLNIGTITKCGYDYLDIYFNQFNSSSKFSYTYNIYYNLVENENLYEDMRGLEYYKGHTSYEDSKILFDRETLVTSVSGSSYKWYFTDMLKKFTSNSSFIQEKQSSTSGNTKVGTLYGGRYLLVLRVETYCNGYYLGAQFIPVAIHYTNTGNRVHYAHLDYLSLYVDTFSIQHLPYVIESKTHMKYNGYMSIDAVDVEIGMINSIYTTEGRVSNLTNIKNKCTKGTYNTTTRSSISEFEYKFNFTDSNTVYNSFGDRNTDRPLYNSIAMKHEWEKWDTTPVRIFPYNVYMFSRVNNPVITNFNIYRVDSNDNKDEEGNYIHVNIGANISSIGGKVAKISLDNGAVRSYIPDQVTVNAIYPQANYVTIRLKYKKTIDSSWNTTTFASNAYDLSSNIDMVYKGNTFDPDSSYEFQLEVSDRFATTTSNFTLKTPIVLIDYNSSGKAMAFGKMSEAGPNDIMVESIMPFIFSDKFNLHSTISNGNLGMITQSGTNSLQYYDLVNMRTSGGTKQYAITCFDTDNRSYSSSTDLPLMRLAVGNGTYLDIGYRTMKYFQYWQDDYIEFAPEDTYCYVRTNSSYFYFDKPIYMQGNLVATQSWVTSQLSSYVTSSTFNSYKSTLDSKLIGTNFTNVPAINSGNKFSFYLSTNSNSGNKLQIIFGQDEIAISSATAGYRSKWISFGMSFYSKPCVIISSNFNGTDSVMRNELAARDVSTSGFYATVRTEGWTNKFYFSYLVIGRS